jgi:hypothetical protein
MSASSPGGHLLDGSVCLMRGIETVEESESALAGKEKSTDDEP